MYPFEIGKQYKRRDIYAVIGVPIDTKGGNWDTGYNKYKQDYFLFCSVGTPGRTGHDYGNRFDGPELHWYAKAHTRISQPQVQELLSPPGYVYVFYRIHDKDPFTFAGLGRPRSHRDETPAQITWEIITEGTDGPASPKEDIRYREGSLKKVMVNSYERNPAARSACIKHFGYKCQVCGFDFQEQYGFLGKDFIHVHHVVPLGEIGEEYQIDPLRDLVPVCANCHAVIHRRRPAYELDEVSKALGNL